MNIIKRYWYLILLLMAALIVDHSFIQWALAVKVGGHTLWAGFKDAYEYYTFLGYLFLTAFRVVPYVVLGTVLVVLSKAGEKGYFFAVLAGGLAGILGLLVWGFWMAQRPYYTDECVSSTTAIAFLFLPYYAALAGAAGAGLLSLIYTPFRLMSARRRG